MSRAARIGSPSLANADCPPAVGPRPAELALENLVARAVVGVGALALGERRALELGPARPRGRVVDVAVGDLRLARLAALERRGRRRALLVKHEADAVGGDRPRRVIGADDVVRPVGPEQPAREAPRDVHTEPGTNARAHRWRYQARSLIVRSRQIGETGLARTERVRLYPGAIRSLGIQTSSGRDRPRSLPRGAIEFASRARRPVLRLACDRAWWHSCPATGSAPETNTARSRAINQTVLREQAVVWSGWRRWRV